LISNVGWESKLHAGRGPHSSDMCGCFRLLSWVVLVERGIAMEAEAAGAGEDGDGSESGEEATA
jgi:hypothetical protein